MNNRYLEIIKLKLSAAKWLIACSGSIVYAKHLLDDDIYFFNLNECERLHQLPTDKLIYILTTTNKLSPSYKPEAYMTHRDYRSVDSSHLGKLMSLLTIKYKETDIIECTATVDGIEIHKRLTDKLNVKLILQDFHTEAQHALMAAENYRVKRLLVTIDSLHSNRDIITGEYDDTHLRLMANGGNVYMNGDDVIITNYSSRHSANLQSCNGLAEMTIVNNELYNKCKLLMSTYIEYI